jgi:hypothetical protein
MRAVYCTMAFHEAVSVYGINWGQVYTVFIAGSLFPVRTTFVFRTSQWFCNLAADYNMINT